MLRAEGLLRAAARCRRRPCRCPAAMLSKLRADPRRDLRASPRSTNGSRRSAPPAKLGSGCRSPAAGLRGRRRRSPAAGRRPAPARPGVPVRDAAASAGRSSSTGSNRPAEQRRGRARPRRASKRGQVARDQRRQLAGGVLVQHAARRRAARREFQRERAQAAGDRIDIALHTPAVWNPGAEATKLWPAHYASARAPPLEDRP